MAPRVAALAWLLLRESEACESYTPSSAELRDQRVEGWGVEQLRGRRWSASVQTSAGGEEIFEGYSRGRCVVGTWTKELPGASAHACVLRCEDTPGCLGVLYGEVESAQKPQVRCFLAGVGKDDVLMEYPSEVVRFSALLELSPTLQCWQKRWQCASPEPEGSPKDRRLAALLEDLQQRLQALPALPALGSAARALRQGAPGHFLLLLGGVCRVLGRAADNADLAVARCFKAAKATLEGPSGSLAVCLLIFPVFGLLGQRLRAWQRQVASWQVSSKTIDLILPREQSGYSTAGALPTLCSAGMMPLDSPDWHAQAEANSPESPEGLGCVPTPHRRMRAMTPPRRRHAPPAKDVEELSELDEASPAPPRVSVRQREAATISARDEGAQLPSERALLRLLNHRDLEVVKKVRFIGDKTAAQILSFRRREGDLQQVSELATRVGLKEALVRKMLKEYNLPQLF